MTKKKAAADLVRKPKVKKAGLNGEARKPLTASDGWEYHPSGVKNDPRTAVENARTSEGFLLVTEEQGRHLADLLNDKDEQIRELKNKLRQVREKLMTLEVAYLGKQEPPRKPLRMKPDQPWQCREGGTKDDPRVIVENKAEDVGFLIRGVEQSRKLAKILNSQATALRDAEDRRDLFQAQYEGMRDRYERAKAEAVKTAASKDASPSEQSKKPLPLIQIDVHCQKLADELEDTLKLHWGKKRPPLLHTESTPITGEYLHSPHVVNGTQPDDVNVRLERMQTMMEHMIESMPKRGEAGGTSSFAERLLAGIEASKLSYFQSTYGRCKHLERAVQRLLDEDHGPMPFRIAVADIFLGILNVTRSPLIELVMDATTCLRRHEMKDPSLSLGQLQLDDDENWDSNWDK